MFENNNNVQICRYLYDHSFLIYVNLKALLSHKPNPPLPCDVICEKPQRPFTLVSQSLTFKEQSILSKTFFRTIGRFFCFVLLTLNKLLSDQKKDLIEFDALFPAGKFVNPFLSVVLWS